jgi:hypothetical protein
MFICQKCKTPSAPCASPVPVIMATRNVEYHNEYYIEDDFGNRKKQEVDSRGWEIAKEVKVCRICAKEFGLDIPEPKVEKPYVRAFEEKLAPAFKIPLVATVVHNALERLTASEAGNKRAGEDCKTSIPLIKGFVDNNKEYVF